MKVTSNVGLRLNSLSSRGIQRPVDTHPFPNEQGGRHLVAVGCNLSGLFQPECVSCAERDEEVLQVFQRFDGVRKLPVDFPESIIGIYA